MEQRELKKQLASYSRIFADTPIFLYFFEQNKKWGKLSKIIFELAEQKKLKLAIFTITSLEVIIGLKREGS